MFDLNVWCIRRDCSSLCLKDSWARKHLFGVESLCVTRGLHCAVWPALDQFVIHCMFYISSYFMAWKKVTYKGEISPFTNVTGSVVARTWLFSFSFCLLILLRATPHVHTAVCCYWICNTLHRYCFSVIRLHQLSKNSFPYFTQWVTFNSQRG